MNIYYENKKDVIKITDEEIQTLAHRIENFLKVYTKNILIVKPENIKSINKLKEITSLMKARKYHELFDNPNVISFEDDQIIEPEDIPKCELTENDVPF